MSLSILACGERLHEHLRLTGLGAPHIWGVQVLDDTLVGFGIFPATG